MERALGLHEFVSGIVRLANRRYARLLGQGLAGKVQAFYDEVLQHLTGIVENADSLPLTRPVRVVLAHHEPLLKRMFDCFKKGDKASGVATRETAADGRTMSVDEFETFCTDSAICGPDSLAYSEPRAIFVALNLDDDLYEQEEAHNRADQLVFEEFKESIALIAQRQISARTKGANHLSTFPPIDVAEEMQVLLRSVYASVARTRGTELRGIDRNIPDDLDLGEHGQEEDDEDGAGGSYCSPLTNLNMSWNSLGNEGAGAIGNALLTNNHLTTVNLAHNDIATIGAVVLADGIRENSTVKDLTLDGNPIGSLGSRAILAAMRSLEEERHISVLECNMMAMDLDTVGLPEFDPADPGGSYCLELSRPYDRAIANELLRLLRASGGYDEWQNVQINGLSFEPKPPSPYSMVDALMNEVVFKTVVDIFGEPAGAEYGGDTTHTLELSYFHEPRPAEQCAVVSDLALSRLKAMMGLSGGQAPSSKDKKENDAAGKQAARLLWKGARTKLRIVGALGAGQKEQVAIASVGAKNNQQLRRLLDLASRELNFSAVQVIEMVDQFGSDRATRIDIIVELFPATVDKDVLREYCERSFEEADLDKIIVGVGMEYSFDRNNPTGHYRAKLEEEDDRNVMIQLINLSNEEKKQREDMGLIDTSQWGLNDQSCFRNVLYDGKNLKQMFGRANPLPKRGFLEFDFVSRGVDGRPRAMSDQLPKPIDRALSDEFVEECKKLKLAVEESAAAGAATVDRVQLVSAIRRWLKRSKAYLRARDVVAGLHALGILPSFVMCKLCSKDGRDEGAVGLGAHGGKNKGPPRPIAHAPLPCKHPCLCEGCARGVTELGIPICCPICTKWSDKTTTLSKIIAGTPRASLHTAAAMLDSIHQTVETTPYTLQGDEDILAWQQQQQEEEEEENEQEEPLDQGPGWAHAGDRAVGMELIVTCYSRCVDLGPLCTDAIGWFFNDSERHQLQQRLGPLNMIDPLMPDGYWELNLKYPDDREVATMLVLLAVGEPGENWRDEKFGDVVVNNGVKVVRKPRPFELPATWEEEVPQEGLLQLHYYTSEKWVDRELRSMLRARCLVGEEEKEEEDEEDMPMY